MMPEQAGRRRCPHFSKRELLVERPLFGCLFFLGWTMVYENWVRAIFSPVTLVVIKVTLYFFPALS